MAGIYTCTHVIMSWISKFDCTFRNGKHVIECGIVFLCISLQTCIICTLTLQVCATWARPWPNKQCQMHNIRLRHLRHIFVWGVQKSSSYLYRCFPPIAACYHIEPREIGIYNMHISKNESRYAVSKIWMWYNLACNLATKCLLHWILLH